MRKLAIAGLIAAPVLLAGVATAAYQIPAESYGCDDNGDRAFKVDGDTVVIDYSREWYIGKVTLNGKEVAPKYLDISYSSDEGDCYKVRYRVNGTTVPTTLTEYNTDGEWLSDRYWNRPLRSK